MQVGILGPADLVQVYSCRKAALEHARKSRLASASPVRRLKVSATMHSSMLMFLNNLFDTIPAIRGSFLFSYTIDLTSAYKLESWLTLWIYPGQYRLIPPNVKESHLSNRHWPKPPHKSSDRQRSSPSRRGPAITVRAYSLKQHLLCVFPVLGHRTTDLEWRQVSRVWRHVLAVWALRRKRHKD